MLGFGSNVRTDVENLDSPTMVKALRQASKNIMFTIVRSGNYTMEQEQADLDRMTTMFIGIDVGVGVVVVGIVPSSSFAIAKRTSRCNFPLYESAVDCWTLPSSSPFLSDLPSTV